MRTSKFTPEPSRSSALDLNTIRTPSRSLNESPSGPRLGSRPDRCVVGRLTTPAGMSRYLDNLSAAVDSSIERTKSRAAS
jgi:hypothetical protein